MLVCSHVHLGPSLKLSYVICSPPFHFREQADNLTRACDCDWHDVLHGVMNGSAGVHSQILSGAGFISVLPV
jgi:hypothetical protein